MIGVNKLDFEEIENIDIVGYNEDTVNKFVSINDKNVNKEANALPEKLRSMFIELTFIGAVYSDPKVAKRFAESMRPKYDFTTDANRFFYETLIKMGRISEWKTSEYTINGFMADDEIRARTYQKFGGYDWIRFAMKMAEENDAVKHIESYYDQIKNYSLLREYYNRGLKDYTLSLVKMSEFKSLKPRQILSYISQRITRIYTQLANSEEVKDLTVGCEDFMLERLESPEQGISFAFPIMTEIFQGIRKKQFMAWGMLSNAGKSRFLMRLISNLAFVQNQKVLIISNEMTEEEMKACLITTTINNPDIQALHGVNRVFRQNCLQNGVYKADAKFIGDEGVIDGQVHRFCNNEGTPIESYEDYLKRVEMMSSEFRDIRKITKWIDEKMHNHIYIIETGSDYSDVDLKQIIENTCLSEGIEYVFYDTFKSDKSALGDWSAMKRTATILSEIAKTQKIFIGANIQLTDDAALTDPLDLTSNNIANSKQIKHVLDGLCLFREIEQSSYGKYLYWESSNDLPQDKTAKEQMTKTLDNATRYYACIVDKNRAGAKPKLLFSLNLDTNIWKEEGRIDLKDNIFPRNKQIKETTTPDGKKNEVQISEYDPVLDA